MATNSKSASLRSESALGASHDSSPERLRLGLGQSWWSYLVVLEMAARIPFHV